MSRGPVEDLRFPGEAYRFLLDALERTRIQYGRDGHVNGRELLEGIREHAADLYGPMAAMVFEEWGIREGSDFGFMVFELVDRGVLARRREDSPTDFEGVSSYRKLFEEEYFDSKSAETPRGFESTGMEKNEYED